MSRAKARSFLKLLPKSEFIERILVKILLRDFNTDEQMALSETVRFCLLVPIMKTKKQYVTIYITRI